MATKPIRKTRKKGCPYCGHDELYIPFFRYVGWNKLKRKKRCHARCLKCGTDWIWNIKRGSIRELPDPNFPRRRKLLIIK